jgi:hypothetical protein
VSRSSHKLMVKEIGENTSTLSNLNGKTIIHGVGHRSFLKNYFNA